ncbi:hypothetical protein Dda_8504 [Drechslerella dactyloides]|uniref:Flavin-containing monooxygenase n=1 Tax=Drechslerella dactyloides TaxID=74499 RepID=A0AAD6IRM4_DREDA|nr:hypothetical protein Dda_8504 [Drechslerella dactyloides]
MALLDIKKVAVIGGGPAGAAVAKCLVAEGLEPVIFEQRPNFGGTWNYTPETKTQLDEVPLVDPNVEEEPVISTSTQPIFLSPIYAELETNIPKGLMGFNNVPFDDDLQLFPKHEDVNKYVQEYSKDLAPLARFCHRVTKVSPRSGGKWEVRSEDLVTRQTGEDVFDAVVAAMGHYNVPYIPPMAGMTEFEDRHPGSILHSKYFRTAHGYENKTVIVVGNSASGVDIAGQLSQVVKTPLYHSCKSADGFKSFPPLAGDHTIAMPTIDEFVPENRTVVFSDGTRVSEVDVIIFCTGYLHALPFFAEPEDPSDRMVTDGFYVHRLYQHMFYIPSPTFAIVGLPTKIIPFPMFECQAAVVAGVFSGRLALPPTDDMDSWEKDLQARKGGDRHFHFLSFPEDADFMDMLNEWNKGDGGPRTGLHEPAQWGPREREIRKNMPKIKLAFMQAKTAGRIVKTMEELGGEKKQYLVEWEGADSQGQPWPAEWKYAYDIDSTAIDDWEDSRRRKKEATSDASPSPPVTRLTRRSKPSTSSRCEAESAMPKSRGRSAKGGIQSPIVISSSPEETAAAASNATAETLSLQPRPRNKRRRILESSPSIGGTTGTQLSAREEEEEGEGYHDDDDGDLGQKPALHHGPSTSEYIVRPTPDPPSPDNREQEIFQRHVRGPIIIPLRPEGPYVESSEEAGRLSNDAEIQVPRTQVPRRGRREIPDSQSSRATSIYQTPGDQKAVVPETPFERFAGRVHYSSGERLREIREANMSKASPNMPPSSLLEDDFADIPDSSNRVFSQDVKELKSQEASQSQSSGNSQKTDRSHQSQNSLPSAQLSFDKIGVAPSTKGSSDRESPASGSGRSAEGSLGRAAVAAAKSVAVVPAAPPSISLHLDQRHQTHLQPQPRPRSASTQDDIESILQEAVESRPPVIVDTPSEHSAQLPQLDAVPPQGQRKDIEGDTTESSDSASQRRAKPADLSVDSEALFPALLSPKTPIKDDDALQGGRSITTTPCGPIPASARPAPVTVLGYSVFQTGDREAAENEELPSSSTVEGSVHHTSTTLNQVVATRRRREKPPPSPLRETRSSARRKRKTSSGEDAMSAAPLSPLPSVDVAAPLAISSPKRQTTVRSSSHLSSPPPAISHPDRPLSTQDNENSHRMDIQYQEPSPAAVDSPIDDDLLAGSQVLSLIQRPAPSTSAEIFLAIPLNDIQKILYKQALLENYRQVENFFGIESSQGHTEHITIEDLDYGEPGPKLVKWFCKQSSKFDLLSKLLQKLRDEDYIVAIVAEDGKLMECLEIFIKSAGYGFTRYDEAMNPLTPLPEGNVTSLRVLLIPSTRVKKDYFTLPAAKLIIGFDSTLDPMSPQVGKLRSNGTATTPIIHFVPINTVAHIMLCLPNSTKSSRQDYINALLFAAMLIRKSSTSDNLLPALQLDPQGSQSETSETNGPEMISSPSRKRVLSISVTPVASGGMHKKQRVEASETPASQNEDTPMEDYDNAVDDQEPFVEVEDSKSGEQASSTPQVPDHIGDITHVTSTIPNESAKNKEAGPAATDQDSSAQDETDAIISERVARMLGDPGWVDNETASDEDLLKQMSKEDLIGLLVGCKAKYLEAKAETKKYEESLSLLQYRYEERRQRIRDLKAEAREHAKQSSIFSTEAQINRSFAETAKAERDRARSDLKQFQTALAEDSEGDKTRAVMIQELSELKPRVTIMDAKLKQTERDLEFAKDRYQNESRQNLALSSENEDLEAQAEADRRKADETKVRLKELNMDRERTKYQNEIKELQAKLERGVDAA